MKKMDFLSLKSWYLMRILNVFGIMLLFMILPKKNKNMYYMNVMVTQVRFRFVCERSVSGN